MTRSLAACIASLAIASTVGAQQGAPSDLGTRIDHIFDRFTRTTPGCGVGLAKDGRTLYVHGYGSSNLEYDVPNTENTVFESGSVAKQFTASAMLMLVADGKLTLDDDIHKYLPEVPSFGGQKITIRNLLTHTSGLRDQWGLLGIEGRGPGTQVHSPLTTLDLVVHQKMLNFPPGSDYLYSNTGYALAALIIERVSGKTLQEFTQERLFKPLGMTHTQLRDDFTRVVPNRATAYSGSEATGFHQDMPFTNMIGNGGVLSTMGDLLKWNENLDHPTVGGPSYVEAIETRMRLTNGRLLTYALGLEVVDYHGIGEVGHSGSTAGYRTFLARYPDQHVSAAVWCNAAYANPTSLLHQVVDLVLVKPSGVAQQQAVSENVTRLPAEVLSKWAGMYRDPHTDQTITLSVANGSLSTGGRGGGPWMPLAADHFRAPLGDVTLSGAAGGRALRLIRADGDTVRYEEVRPATSPRLEDYAGTYTSDELDVVLTLAVKDGKLVMRRRPADEFELRPVYADDFQAGGGGGLGTVRFARGAHGRVTGLAFFAGRVLDVRFRRRLVAASAPPQP
jgi:CubicO group peptidase (beta-lactamase class C family)